MLKFSIKNQRVIRFDEFTVVADSRNYLKAQFTFSSEWNNKIKTAVFVNNGVAYNVLLVEDKCTVPHEVIKNPSFSVSVFGGDLITANVAEIQVQESGLIEGQVPPEPTPTVYSQLVDSVESERLLAESAKDVAIQQATYAEGYKNIAVTKAEEANLSAIDAKSSEDNALISEGNAKLSEVNAGESETVTVQAMTDLLRMMGVDLATLTNGKLTPDQIPGIAITDRFVRNSEVEMLALDAQTGDICIRTDENKTYILSGDASTLSNWQQMLSPTNYADNAGHADTANEAENALMINNHRFIYMTELQFANAVRDTETLYAVGG